MGRFRGRFLVALLAGVLTTSFSSLHAEVFVINMIPVNLSGETEQDSEPNLAVNAANPLQMVATAFTPGAGNVCPPEIAPVFVSSDGGQHWFLLCMVPSDELGLTGDITVDFGLNGDLYAGILRRPGGLRLNILRSTEPFAGNLMEVLVDQPDRDQPWIEVFPFRERDFTLTGNNDLNLHTASGGSGRTATVERSLDASLSNPPFDPIRVEARTTSGQDGPSVRPTATMARDNTIFAAYFGWRSVQRPEDFVSDVRADVVVVRDDDAAQGVAPFRDLVGSDGRVGRRVVTNVPIRFSVFPKLGQERVGSHLTIAADPNDSSRVYLAWGQGNPDSSTYGLHLRRSLDGGANWSPDLRVIQNGINPALAINEDGVVGFLYQHLQGSGETARWITRLELSLDAFTSRSDVVLANVPANEPEVTFTPYIGDYIELLTLGSEFLGVFSANNDPDASHFPNGVTYQRIADFSSGTLRTLDESDTVEISIDPFFFRTDEDPPRPGQTRLTLRVRTVPATDPGRFTLKIDGQTVGTNLRHNDTAVRTVTPGVHQVTQVAGSGTSLSNYATSFSGFCASGGSVALEAGERRTCTVINTHIGSIEDFCEEMFQQCLDLIGSGPNEDDAKACNLQKNQCLEGLG